MVNSVRFTPVILLAALIAGCKPNSRGNKPTSQAPSSAANDSLRHELVQRARADQAVRTAFFDKVRPGAEPDSATVARLAAPMLAVDSANRIWMRGVVGRFGWPGRRLVGDSAARAAWLLVQHADADTALQAQVLPLMERAVANGDANAQDYALLADRVAVARGQPQIYGSQARLDSGRFVFDPIADSAHVDERRAKLGLPPLAAYARMLDSVYRPVAKP